MQKKWPFGVVTLSLLLLAFAIEYWPEPPCQRLQESLEIGYFMQWHQPTLLLVFADKSQYQVTGDTKQQACLTALDELEL